MDVRVTIQCKVSFIWTLIKRVLGTSSTTKRHVVTPQIPSGWKFYSETNVELCGDSDKMNVWRSKGEAFQPEYIVPNVKSGIISIWGPDFASSDPCATLKVHLIIKRN